MSDKTANVETTTEVVETERRSFTVTIPLPSKKMVRTIVLTATAVGAIGLTVARLKGAPIPDPTNTLVLDASEGSTDETNDTTPNNE